MKFLIVEDDQVNRLFMNKYLSKYGVCDEAVNGVDALTMFNEAFLSKQPYDLVCLDIMLPRIDGIRVLKQIRELEKKQKTKPKDLTRVIMISALNDEQSIIDCETSGSDAFLWKPIEIEQFHDILTNMNLIV